MLVLPAWKYVREGVAKLWRATAYLGQTPGNDGPPSFVVANVVLYQPDSVLKVRLPDARAFADYYRALEDICWSFFAGGTTPELLDVVVVIRPGKRSRVWFVSNVRPEEDSTLSELKVRLEAIEAPEIQNGPVAFALSAAINGELRAKPDPAQYAPPFPNKWAQTAGADRRTQSFDEFLENVWPDAP